MAGNGTATFGGDDGPATAADLNGATDVTVDAAGNLYIADTNNQRIRKVDTGGTITTVAGDGTVGFTGDGGPATGASLNSPAGVTADAAGNLYIADFFNHAIRKVDAGGTITTVADNGIAGFSGDGGPATSAQLSFPDGVAFDAAGNLFIADRNNHRIRKVDAATRIITTVAGDGTAAFAGDGGLATAASLSSPWGVALDAAGNIFIVDNGNDSIRRVDASTGIITTVAGTGTQGFSGDGGPATSAMLNFPTGVAVDTAGNFYIADQANHRVRKVDTGGTITTVAGTGTAGFSGDGGPATSAMLIFPWGVAVDTAGNLFITDRNNHRIRKVDTTGTIRTVAGTGTQGFSGDDGPATSADMNFPSGVTLDAAGNIFTSEQGNNRVRRVTFP